jgi:hypothetical protein
MRQEVTQMVKKRKQHINKAPCSKGFLHGPGRPSKIGPSTRYDTCTERLSPFGGLLALIKFLDLIDFENVFKHTYRGPTRDPKLGHYRMVMGILMLLFIGFNRLWHFVYIRLDAMVCGVFALERLPAASTFWRYVDSLGINQANCLLRTMAAIRERLWQQCHLEYHKVHVSLDTTVKTLYGEQQGGRKGHNPHNPGKKGYRPVLCFIDETREYLLGKLRKGETLSGEETGRFINDISKYLPGCVKKVLLRADGEFFSWQSVDAAMQKGFDFIIANKRAKPPFDPSGWRQPWKRKSYQYNSVVYQPLGWEKPCRFVAMRIPKEEVASSEQVQWELFDEDRYIYRVFCTNLKGKAHNVVSRYDKRADVENLIAEAKGEGLDAIPSAKFKTNYAYLQIVMLAYNIWRYFKIMAQKSSDLAPPSRHEALQGIEDNTIRIARLKLLLIAAKLVFHDNTDKVKFSLHDTRVPAMQRFLVFIDTARARARPWSDKPLWPLRFSFN